MAMGWLWDGYGMVMGWIRAGDVAPQINVDVENQGIFFGEKMRVKK
jgi:hypothetical protein